MQLGLKHGGEGEDAVARFATHVLIHRQHVALRVAHVVGRHKLVRAVGRVLVGHRLGDALAHGVVVEVEVWFLTACGAGHVRDLARHRPFVAQRTFATIIYYDIYTTVAHNC